MLPPTENRPTRSFVWPVAITMIAVIAILSVTLYLMVRRVSEIPAAVGEQARETLDTALALAEAFRQGTVETRFHSYATSVQGNTYLQVATVERVEAFTREDRASIFWGAVQLPDVVVSATVPAQYTAYVDLDERWDLELEGDTVKVVAPRIRFNRPAVDISNVVFEVESDSLLRSEDAAIEQLERELTSQLHLRSRDLVPVVRETARTKVEGFVRSWLLQNFTETDSVRVEVLFEDETRPPVPVLEQRPDD